MARTTQTNRFVQLLSAGGSVGFLFALMLGKGDHLARLPLLIGGIAGTLGLALKNLPRSRGLEAKL